MNHLKVIFLFVAVFFRVRTYFKTNYIINCDEVKLNSEETEKVKMK
jgi:hypothetical protein